MCQADDTAKGERSSASPLQAEAGAEAYKPTVIRCAVSHLPAGHPNACCDCDPCLMHNPKTQRDALWADWEGMYWEIRALRTGAADPGIWTPEMKSAAMQDAQNVCDLSMLVRRLLRRIEKGLPLEDIAAKADDFLRRKGLNGNILRGQIEERSDTASPRIDPAEDR